MTTKTETLNKLSRSFQRTTSLEMKANKLSYEIEEIKALSLVTKMKNCDIFNSNMDNTSKHSLSEKEKRSDSAITLVGPNILSPCSAVTTEMAEMAEMAEIAQLALMLLKIEEAAIDERYVEKAEIIEKIKTDELDDPNNSAKIKLNSSISSIHYPSLTSKRMLTIDASGKDKNCTKRQQESDSAITLADLNIPFNPKYISIISVKRIIHNSNFEYYYTIQLAPSPPMENSLFVTRSYQDFWILHCHLILSPPKSARTFPFLESSSPSNAGSSCTITQALQNRRRISIYLKSLLDYPLSPRGREILRYFLSPNPKSRHDYSSSIFKSSFITLLKFAPIILMDASKTTHPLDIQIDTPSLEYLYLEASEKIDENISSLYFQDEFGDIVELGSGVLLSQLRLTLDEVILFSCAPI